MAKDARGDLFFFILILVGLFVVWIATGGPDRARHEKEGSSTTNNDARTIIQEDDRERPSGIVPAEGDAEEISPLPAGTSPYENKVTIVKSSSGPRRDEVSREYIEIRADRRNTAPISITGWRVASVISGRSYAIGRGTRLPQTGLISPEEAILLNPDDRAYIATGRSPIGISFRTNTCTGYFEQFQDFSPSLRSECPLPRDELDVTTNVIQTFGNRCVDFIERMPRCQMELKTLPAGFGPECVEFITTEINYTGCVDRHRNDEDFFKNEWRVYLGRDEEIWRERRETIRLLDAEGLLVDTFTY